MSLAEREKEVRDAVGSHFALANDLACEKTAFITAYFERVTPTVLVCTVLDGERGVREVEFLRSEISAFFYSGMSLLIEVPKVYLTIFGLHDDEVTGETLDTVRKLVAAHNAPYLKQNGRSTEKVGNVRI